MIISRFWFALASSAYLATTMCAQPTVRLDSSQWRFPGSVTEIAYSADGKGIGTSEFSVGISGTISTIRVLDAETGKELRSLKTPDGNFINSMSLAADGKLATFFDNK